MTILEQFRLDGQVALVTGAGSGIGLAIAQAYAEAGARVAAVDLSVEAAQPGLDAIRAAGGEGLALGADVSREDQLEAAFAAVDDAFGPVSIAVANAGIGGGMIPLAETPLGDWERVIDVNLTGAFLTYRAAARRMVPARRGSIIAVASIYGVVGDFGGMAYAYTAAKGGLVNLTRTAAVHLAPQGVRVNGIAPAFIRTNIAGGLLKHETPETKPFLDEIRHRTPMGDLGEPEDTAGAAVFLASPAARYVTGVTLPVDGGWLAW